MNICPATSGDDASDSEQSARPVERPHLSRRDVREREGERLVSQELLGAVRPVDLRERQRHIMARP
jgi:hypothetical protein